MKGKMMADANAILLVMQNPKECSAAAHRDWYVTHHLPDVCGVPGVLRGEFAAVTPAADQPRWSNAALYWLGGDGAAILGEVFRRAGSGDWVMSDTLDGATMLMAVGEALTGRVRSAITPDAEGKDRLLYIVLTNSTPGDDAAFNAWYDDVHLPDADLAYFEEGSLHFRDYVRAVGWAQKYAEINREVMMRHVLEAARKVLHLSLIHISEPTRPY